MRKAFIALLIGIACVIPMTAQAGPTGTLVAYHYTDIACPPVIDPVTGLLVPGPCFTFVNDTVATITHVDAQDASGPLVADLKYGSLTKQAHANNVPRCVIGQPLVGCYTLRLTL